MINKKLAIFILFLTITLLFISCVSSDNESKDVSSEENVSLVESIDDSSNENVSSISSISSDLLFSDESEEDEEPEESEETYESVEDGVFIEEVSVEVETYQNSLLSSETPGAWPWYGFGDPFIMRYNGKYYLYSSTHDWYSSIKVWISDDLVNWTYGGECIQDETVKAAYAPEVTYYNGSFYMYTSPAGNGHYVLKADNPLGPFTIMTENLGNSIDGHVFIDDDGRWYFYHAWSGELKAHEMNSPYDLSGRDESTGASVAGGWTEGPMVIKRNGVYYLTYCGNHVWSRGYRIEGAVSTTSPLMFSDVLRNIIMVNTTLPNTGIGHSSTVLGPDMDTYYIVYHSFIRAGSRLMNIDALSLNGKDFLTVGPTTTPQQVPKKPAISTDSKSTSDSFVYKKATIKNSTLSILKSGFVISKDVVSSEKFTAEVNFKSITQKAGIVFSYVDKDNYAIACIDVATQKINILSYTNGEETKVATVSLPTSFKNKVDFTVLQALSMKKDGEKYSFYLNGLSIGTVGIELPTGQVGAMVVDGEAALGYMAISFEANGSSLKTLYKPVEGKFHAITSIEDGETLKKQAISYAVMRTNSIRNYYVNVGKTASYDVGISYYSKTDSVMEIYKGGECLGSIVLPNTKGVLSSVSFRNINLEKSFGIISFRLSSGKANILTYDFVESEPLSEKIGLLSKPQYSDGTWMTTSKRILFQLEPEAKISHGKILYGSEKNGDYAFSSTISFTKEGGEIGMLIRAKNPSLGGAGDNSIQGRYFYQGYYICLDWEKGIILYDVNYSRGEVLSYYEMTFSEKTEYSIKVEAKGNVIKIYLDGSLISEVADNTPFFNGAYGFSGYGATATVKNVLVEKID